MARHMDCILYVQAKYQRLLSNRLLRVNDRYFHSYPTFPPIFICLYLHNVWCLHQQQSNSDGKIKAVLVGHGKSHWKTCILPFLLGFGLEAQDLFFIYSWVSWEELVVALCQLNRIVIQSSLEPVYLNDSLRRKQTAKELFHSTKAFQQGKICFEKSLHAVWVYRSLVFIS